MVLTWLKKTWALTKKAALANAISFAAKGASFGGVWFCGGSMGLEYPKTVALTASEVVSWSVFFVFIAFEWWRQKRKEGATRWYPSPLLDF